MELDYDRIDALLLPALENFPPLDINRDNITRIREIIAAQPAKPKPNGLIEEQIAVPSDDGDINVYVYRKSDTARQSALIWIHGGGYIMGSAEDNRAMQIAMAFDCTVFSVDYRLAPEHPFPAGPEDCYATLKWVMEGKSGYDLNLDKVALGGASAGGGMAAGVALMNRDRDNFPLRLQLLLYPMIDNFHATESGKYQNHPVWKQQTSFNAWEMYLNGNPGEDASPYAAATRAKSLEGLPPTYITVGTEDLFRDEDIEYANRLIAAGIPTEFSVFPGIYHAAEGLVPDAPVSKRMTLAFMNALEHALG
jgi:acetyl esterase/lipase